ncbi:MAG TPA: WD40 repeat domain-containing protein [Terriglobales bacterium]|nr:WD40 repeat domain-containing protein [Terriglobales bacterium]
MLWLALAATALAQSAAPELVVQRANTGPCRHIAFSHDGRLLATDNQDEVLLWEVSTGRLLNSMKPYLSPIIHHHLDTGGTEVGGTRAKGTLVFSPDDKFVAVLPVDFAEILNFGPPGAPSSIWYVDSGLPLSTAQWNLDGPVARNPAAPSTPEVETWMLSGNRQNLARLLENGMRLQAISSDGTVGAVRNDTPRNQEHIQLIDLKTGRVLRTLDVNFDDVLAMVLSPDGRYLAAHSSNRRFVTVWDTASGAELTEIRQNVQYPSVGQLAFSPDGRWLAVQYSGEIALFETATWKRVSSSPYNSGFGSSGDLVFTPDSRVLAIASETVSVVDVATGKPLQTMCSSPLHGLAAVGWNRTSGVLALAGDKVARVWSSATAAVPATLSTEGTIHAMGLSPDGQVALGTRDDDHDVKGHTYYEGNTKIWKADDLQKAITLGAGVQLPLSSGGSSNSVDFSADGKLIAAAMLDELPCESRHPDSACNTDEIPFVGLLTLWNTATGNLLRQRRQPDPNLNVVAFSPDGTQIATGQQNQIVKVYDAATLNRSRAFPNPQPQPPFGVQDYGTSALAYSPDGKLLLAGSETGVVWVLDAAGNTPSRILHEYEEFDPEKPNQRSFGPIVAVFFSADGKRAWAVQSSGRVWLWNTNDWSSAGSYQAEPGASSAGLSPNGKVIAIANRDGAVRFYAAETGQLKLVLASAAPDGALVVATDGRYDFGLASDLALAAFRVGRKTVNVDRLQGNRRVQGLLGEFLKENAAPDAKVSSADRR